MIGIQVDVFGKCGNLTTPKENVNDFLEKNYKFYFAFENTLCIDYVTEKLFKVMDFYIIPVVYAGANFSRFAPPKSYIDANSFATVENLAAYLKYLSENPKEYVKFFWWKKYYKARTIEQFDFAPSHMCKICKKFNDPFLATKRQTYLNIKDWFQKDVCKGPSIKF